MKISASIDLQHAFVMRPVNIDKIWSVLTEAIGKVEVTAHCSDSIDRKFSNPDDLCKYENARTKSILSLNFRSRSKDHDASASLSFETKSYNNSIQFDIEGPETTVLAVKDRFDELFDGMRPWYSIVTKVDFFYIVGGILLFLAMVMTLVNSTSPSLNFSQAVYVSSILVLILVTIPAVIWLLNRMRRRFFPVATFAIGQGQARFDFDEKIRWVVIVGFVVSVFSSLVVAFLLRQA